MGAQMAVLPYYGSRYIGAQMTDDSAASHVLCLIVLLVTSFV